MKHPRPSRSFILFALLGCGAACGDSDPDGASSDGSTGGATETEAASVPETSTDASTSSEDPSTSTSEAETDAPTGTDTEAGSTTDADTDTDAETDTDTDGTLPACEAPAEDFETVAWILGDPFCFGGHRCFAHATCTVSGTTAPSEENERWSYTLSCDGEWTEYDRPRHEKSGETREESGVEIEVSSSRELDFGEGLLEYETDNDFSDEFGGVDRSFKGLNLDGERVVFSRLGEGAGGFGSLTVTSLEDEQCDGTELPAFPYDCVWPRGLVGETARGEPISIVNAAGRVDPWLITSEGWEQCGEDVTGAYTRTIRINALHTDIIVDR